MLMAGLLFTLGCGGEKAAGGAGGDQAAAAPAAAEAPAAADVAGNPEGERVYGTVCVTCHQADGNGLPGAFPPLAGSAVATGDAAVPIKIVLHGLTGQLTINGDTFNGMMTPWGSTLSDAEVAAVLTYVRSNFGNSAEAVTEAQVAEVRAATSGQTAPFTTADLGIAGE